MSTENKLYVLVLRNKNFWCIGPFATDENAETWAREFSPGRWSIIYVPERWMMPIDIVSPDVGKSL